MNSPDRISQYLLQLSEQSGLSAELSKTLLEYVVVAVASRDGAILSNVSFIVRRNRFVSFGAYCCFRSAIG